jgi:putative SOS response-associated peptidase YedK
MCSHYQAITDRERLKRHFGGVPPADLGKHDLWPGYVGNFCRRHPRADLVDVGDEAVSAVEILTGIFGLVPPWSPDTKISRLTYNARSETVASKPSFREAWQRAQHCIIAADAFYEPDWRSGKAIPTRIARTDGEPMGLAGLWSAWISPQGEVIYSYTLLTIHASQHPLMRLLHKPMDEKRMVVILPPEHYAPWLQANADQSRGFMRQFPASLLKAEVASSPQQDIFGG